MPEVSRMYIELPDTISPALLEQCRPAVETLRALLATGALPPGLTAASVQALLTVMTALPEAAAEDHADLSPSEAARRLGMARPSVMRLIARGELSSRKEGGHYVLPPRDLRSFQARLAATRRETLTGLSRMAEEFGF